MQKLAPAAPAMPASPLGHLANLAHLAHLPPWLLLRLPLLAAGSTPARPPTAALGSSTVMPFPLLLMLVLVGDILERNAQQAAAAAQAAAQPCGHTIVLQRLGSGREVGCWHYQGRVRSSTNARQLWQRRQASVTI